MQDNIERRARSRYETEANIMYARYLENPYCYYGAKIFNCCEDGFYFESKYELQPGSCICFNKAIYATTSRHSKPYELLPVTVRWCREMTSDNGTYYGIGVNYADSNDPDWKNSPAGLNTNPNHLLTEAQSPQADLGISDGGKKWHAKIATDLKQAREIAVSRANDLATLNRFALPGKLEV